jgi:stage IV sporulation protein A
MKDFSCFDELFVVDENFKSCNLVELNLGKGVSNYEIVPKEEYFYKIISSECKEEIKDDYELIKYIKTFSDNKIKFAKLQNALKDAEENGYGVVFPTIDEMNLEEPVLVKQGGKYGVKLKATAPSLHIVKVDVGAEVSPIVGTEKQGEDLVNFIMSKFEDNPQGIWETNLFGKSLYDLVGEGLSGKINAMPKDAKIKMRKTLNRIINENKGGLICILL